MIIYLQMLKTEEERCVFERIYRQYGALMYHVAYQILGSVQDTEDAVHQAFVSVAENISKIKTVESPQTRSYVVVIAEHKAIDLLRKQNKCIPVDFEMQESGLAVEPPGDHGLADAMARLPARYREVLLLRYDNGYSTGELAGMLGIKRGSVQKLILRAKKALEAQLGKE